MKEALDEQDGGNSVQKGGMEFNSVSDQFRRALFARRQAIMEGPVPELGEIPPSYENERAWDQCVWRMGL